MRSLIRRRELLAGGAIALAGLGLGPLGALRAAVPDRPRTIGLTAAREWAARPDIMRYDVADVHAVHYAEVATALGVSRLRQWADQQGLADPMAEYTPLVADRWDKARLLPNTANHVDANVVGIWPMLLGDPDGAGVTLADAQWAETDADGLTTQARFWIDDVWMIGALQAEAWRLTDEDRFADRAALTARIYLERLQQPNGLFHHGPDAPHFWGRGNGWVAAGLAEVLGTVPRDHPDWEAILAGYHRMMDALLEHQAADGMWRQLIDQPDSWAETSCTAMFAYAMHAGVRMGFLGSEHYDAAIKAWRVFDYLDDRGRLTWICTGTGQSADPQYYLDRPVVTGDLHGQAALLWLEAEVLRVIALS
jgi:unsaturated rhamnogalacturonyl hydrolase